MKRTEKFLTSKGIQVTVTEKQKRQVKIVLDYLKTDQTLLKAQNTKKQMVKMLNYGVDSLFLRRFIRIAKYCNGSYTLKKAVLYYGKEKGLKLWDEYKNQQALTNTFEYKNKKYGMSKEEFEKYNNSRAVTKENLINRHGKEKGIEKWNKYVVRQSYAGCKLEYFQEKYGKNEGKKIYEELNKKKAHTLESFVEKYGVVLGKQKFEDYICKSKSCYSKISQELFWEVYKKLSDKLKEKTYFAELNNEFGKMTPNGNFFKYDFVISDINFCIEFNGNIYHANPLFYEANDIPKFRGNEKTAGELWEKDKIKNEYLTTCGFYVMVVWEEDYRNNEEKVVNEILAKIEEMQIENRRI